MHRGYVKLWRCMNDSGIAKNHGLFTFWVQCLLAASHKEHDQQVGNQSIHLSPGQFIFGRKKWAEKLGASEKQVRLWVEACVKQRRLEATFRASNFTVYSVINWGIYQDDLENEGQQEGQHKGQPRASQGPAKGQPRATNKNDKNEKNEKRIRDLSPSEDVGDDDPIQEHAVSPILTTVKNGEKANDCPHEKIIALYHEILPANPRVEVWSEDKQRNLRARWREDKARQSVEWWKSYFETVKACPFLVGEVDTKTGPYFIDLGTLVKPSKLADVLNGKYAKRKGQGDTPKKLGGII